MALRRQQRDYQRWLATQRQLRPALLTDEVSDEEVIRLIRAVPTHHSGIAFVQTAALGSTSNGTSQATSAFGVNPTVGNYIVAWGWGWSSNTSSPVKTFTSSTTNTWTTVGLQSITNDLWCCLGWAKVTSTGASFTVTLTNTSGGGSGAIMVVASEFSGIVSASPVDGAAVGTAPGTTANTGMAPGSLSFTAGDLVCGVWVNGDGTNPSHINGVTSGSPGTAPTGFTAVGTQYNGSTFEIGQAAYAINPSSPSNPSWSCSPDTAAKWGAAQFALKAVASSFPGEDEGSYILTRYSW